ncbi:uncharacterized protein LOC111025844 [Momordica charantia]|uniref:Uncharacterized protein LOC111025844 n=1 Tax=Momordica charantia TaxID=3673 RepID=A0A6J1E3V7_MOMCH|nr:uncharacterized protein LOC111025844 [Momordica charantia]
MRSTNVLASLLLIFSFLSNQAQGIRLGNGIIKPIGQLEKSLAEESPLIEEGFGKIFTLCRKGQCNSGNIRKLLTATSPSSSTPSITRNNDEGGNFRRANPISKKEELSVKDKKELDNSEAVSENLEAGQEHNPDLGDIAEMDYSLARGKPPIHH